MRTSEGKARTREEAIKSALRELGIELSDVEKIEIVDEGSKGFLGLGKRDVHVRITADLPEVAPKRREQSARPERGEQGARGGRDDRGPRNGDRARGGRGDRPNRADRGESKPEKSADSASPVREDSRPERGGERGGQQRQGGQQERGAPSGNRGNRNDRGGSNDRGPRRDNRGDQGGQGPSRDSKPVSQADRNDNPEELSKPRNDRAERSGRPARQEGGRDRSDRPPREPRGERGPREPRADRPPRERVRRERPERKELDPETAEKLGREAAALLNEVISSMGIEATVASAKSETNDIVLNVTSADSATLIGRKGRTLSSLQFLINRMTVNREDVDASDRLIVDVEGYLERRRAALTEMAHVLSARAKEAGQSVRVKPLNPQDRRVVHLALEGDEEIRTFSLGNSLHRRVVIVPKAADEAARSRGERIKEADMIDADDYEIDPSDNDGDD